MKVQMPGQAWSRKSRVPHRHMPTAGSTQHFKATSNTIPSNTPAAYIFLLFFTIMALILKILLQGRGQEHHEIWALVKARHRRIWNLVDNIRKRSLGCMLAWLFLTTWFSAMFLQMVCFLRQALSTNEIETTKTSKFGELGFCWMLDSVRFYTVA